MAQKVSHYMNRHYLALKRAIKAGCIINFDYKMSTRIW